MAPPVETFVGGDKFEFRVCRAVNDGDVQLFAELNIGGERRTAADEPRSAIYLSDHRYAPASANRFLANVGTAVNDLVTWVYANGYEVDPHRWRSDLVKFGEFRCLKNALDVCPVLDLPGPTRERLVAFAAPPFTRRVRGPFELRGLLRAVDSLTGLPSLPLPGA